MINERSGQAVETANVRTAAGPGHRENVRLTVAVTIDRGDADTAGETRVVGEEVERLRHGGSAHVEDDHVWSAAGARPGDNIGPAIAVDVAAGYVNTGGEILIERKEAEEARAVG